MYSAWWIHSSCIYKTKKNSLAYTIFYFVFLISVERRLHFARELFIVFCRTHDKTALCRSTAAPCIITFLTLPFIVVHVKVKNRKRERETRNNNYNNSNSNSQNAKESVCISTGKQIKTHITWRSRKLKAEKRKKVSLQFEATSAHTCMMNRQYTEAVYARMYSNNWTFIYAQKRKKAKIELKK